MRLYIKRPQCGVDAVAEYDTTTGIMTVLKGSRVSDSISRSEKFRGVKSIEKSRVNYVEESVVLRDALFKSPSTAANFVTGTSTNGKTAWRDYKGRRLKEILETEEL